MNTPEYTNYIDSRENSRIKAERFLLKVGIEKKHGKKLLMDKTNAGGMEIAYALVKANAFKDRKKARFLNEEFDNPSQLEFIGF